MAELGLNLSGIELTLQGMPASFARIMTTEWSAFLVPAVRDPVLRIQVDVEDPAETTAPFAPERMRVGGAKGVGTFALPGGEARLEPDGSAQARLQNAGRESYFNLVNLLIACLAARLPSRGAGLVHAASLLLGDRAYLLIGSEGAGKSSWARLGLQAGARSLGDDLVLVEGNQALGSPFRSRHLPGKATPGRWAVGAIFFPHHGSPARRSPATRLLALARLTANLPFVAASGTQDKVVARFADRLVDAVPCYDLTFALDDSFLPLLVP
jgi:hypothetical protein